MTNVVTSREAFHDAAGDAPTGARVPVEVQATVRDPFTAYRRARNDDGGFYLATTGGQPGWGYFGVEPYSFHTVAADEGDSLATLEELVASETLVRGDCEVPYPCGAVGWLSYDVAREIESLPDEATDDRALPRMQVGLYDCVAAWEEPREDSVPLRVTACPRLAPDERGADEQIDDAYDRGRKRALSLARTALDGDLTVETSPLRDEQVRFESDCTRREFAARTETVKRHIRDGETFQANVSQRLTAPRTIHPVAVFDALRRVNPAPYSALVEFAGIDLVSASPELLCERVGQRVITEPIAGTRPRGETSREDSALEDDLRTDEKERAEHAMLVDLERNDLGKISDYGSVEVSEYRRIDRYASVMHLVSVVEGRLREGVGLAELLAAVFPGGTITGAPKPRTMEIIDAVETTHRGPYTGSLGIVGFDERATFNILIRTLVGHEETYSLRVGAGIVHDSVSDREYDETLDKARGLIDALDRALGEHVDVTVAERGAGEP